MALDGEWPGDAQFAPGSHTVRVGFPLTGEPDATGQRPRAVSDPVEIVTATEEDGETTIELRKCLGRITARIGKLKGRYRELEELDDVKLGGSIAANPDNPLHLGFEYSHRFDGWDKNKRLKIGDVGCLIAVRFGSPDNPSAMMLDVSLPRFDKLVARYFVLDSGGEGGPAGKFHQTVTAVIREELESLRDGSPGVSGGGPGKGVQEMEAGDPFKATGAPRIDADPVTKQILPTLQAMKLEKSNERIVVAGGDKGFDAKLAAQIVRSLSACMLREEVPVVPTRMMDGPDNPDIAWGAIRCPGCHRGSGWRSLPGYSFDFPAPICWSHERVRPVHAARRRPVRADPVESRP